MKKPKVFCSRLLYFISTWNEFYNALTEPGLFKKPWKYFLTKGCNNI